MDNSAQIKSMKDAPGLLRLRELLVETKKQLLQAVEHEAKRAELIVERLESMREQEDA